MGGRASLIEKVFGVFFLGAFITWVIPNLHPSNFFGVSLVLMGITVISFALGKFLSGESDRIMLVVIAGVVILEALIFTLTPLGL